MNETARREPESLFSISVLQKYVETENSSEGAVQNDEEKTNPKFMLDSMLRDTPNIFGSNRVGEVNFETSKCVENRAGANEDFLKGLDPLMASENATCFQETRKNQDKVIDCADLKHLDSTATGNIGGCVTFEGESNYINEDVHDNLKNKVNNLNTINTGRKNRNGTINFDDDDSSIISESIQQYENDYGKNAGYTEIEYRLNNPDDSSIKNTLANAQNWILKAARLREENPEIQLENSKFRSTQILFVEDSGSDSDYSTHDGINSYSDQSRATKKKEGKKANLSCEGNFNDNCENKLDFDSVYSQQNESAYRRFSAGLAESISRLKWKDDGSNKIKLNDSDDLSSSGNVQYNENRHSKGGFGNSANKEDTTSKISRFFNSFKSDKTELDEWNDVLNTISIEQEIKSRNRKQKFGSVDYGHNSFIGVKANSCEAYNNLEKNLNSINLYYAKSTENYTDNGFNNKIIPSAERECNGFTSDDLGFGFVGKPDSGGFDGSQKSIQRAINIGFPDSFVTDATSANNMGEGKRAEEPSTIKNTVEMSKKKVIDFYDSLVGNKNKHVFGETKDCDTNNITNGIDPEIIDEWRMQSLSPSSAKSTKDYCMRKELEPIENLKNKTNEIISSTANNAKSMFSWVANKAEDLVSKPKVSLDESSLGPISKGFNSFPPELAKQVGLYSSPIQEGSCTFKKKSIDEITLRGIAYNNEWDMEDNTEKNAFSVTARNSLSDSGMGIIHSNLISNEMEKKVESCAKPLIFQVQNDTYLAKDTVSAVNAGIFSDDDGSKYAKSRENQASRGPYDSESKSNSLKGPASNAYIDNESSEYVYDGGTSSGVPISSNSANEFDQIDPNPWD
ncbi:hypothetical protein AYI69_g4294 [Smittium culicis]|uniref:Uncharacterized protein n=1 Tax=Smittium culicis TaxID=133412 RepID=A0A1R1YEW4_9FUNG|nr:hypothetical protein AYI69_g4294 [Smittium culicis]